jgi:putative flippase GtrA
MAGKLMFKKEHLILVVKHLFVSALSAITELTAFYLLHMVMGGTLLASHIIAFSCATILGFVLHSFFTFSVGRLRYRNAMFFSIQALIAMAIGYQILKLLVTIGIHPMLAKILQLGATFFFNVLFGKFLSFKK